MNTKEFATLCGVEKRTLFHYDQIGLLKPIRVRENGYREYAKEQLGTMDMIKIFQASGYSLSEIKGMLAGNTATKSRYLKDAVERIDNQLEKLTEMKAYLKDKQSLLHDYQMLPVGTCRIEERSLCYDEKEVDSKLHFFSFLRDGTYSCFRMEENDRFYVCKIATDGAHRISGKAISFFLEIPSSEEHLPRLIREQLNAFQFDGECCYYMESMPHFLLDNSEIAVLKITVFERKSYF